MKKVLKYLTLALIVANYLLCLFNLLRGEFTHALNEFTIGTLSVSYTHLTLPTKRIV